MAYRIEITATLDIDAPKGEVLKFLRKSGAVFCLTSALQYYDAYFWDPSICVYSSDEKVLEELRKFREGNLEVNIYEPDLLLKENTVTMDSVKLTSEVRTIIDFPRALEFRPMDEQILRSLPTIVGNWAVLST
jgi:hypothetical protein